MDEWKVKTVGQQVQQFQYPGEAPGEVNLERAAFDAGWRVADDIIESLLEFGQDPLYAFLGQRILWFSADFGLHDFVREPYNHIIRFDIVWFDGLSCIVGLFNFPNH